MNDVSKDKQVYYLSTKFLFSIPVNQYEFNRRSVKRSIMTRGLVNGFKFPLCGIYIALIYPSAEAAVLLEKQNIYVSKLSPTFYSA
jgi:hypothetical protein